MLVRYLKPHDPRGQLVTASLRMMRSLARLSGRSLREVVRALRAGHAVETPRFRYMIMWNHDERG
jgi:hypothetical protein